jgi:hypothetical protein
MKNPEVSKLTLATAQRRPIITAVCNALDARDNTGTFVTQVCNVVRSTMHGKPLSDADAKAIVDDVADARGWRGDTANTRKSEVRVILDTYAVLPELVRYAKDKGNCNWHFALKMARVRRKDPKLSVASVYSKASKKGGATVTPEGRIASALKALWKAKRAKRSVYTQVWELLKLEGDIA